MALDILLTLSLNPAWHPRCLGMSFVLHSTFVHTLVCLFAMCTGIRCSGTPRNQFRLRPIQCIPSTPPTRPRCTPRPRPWRCSSTTASRHAWCGTGRLMCTSYLHATILQRLPGRADRAGRQGCNNGTATSHWVLRRGADSLCPNLGVGPSRPYLEWTDLGRLCIDCAPGAHRARNDLRRRQPRSPVARPRR